MFDFSSSGMQEDSCDPQVHHYYESLWQIINRKFNIIKYWALFPREDKLGGSRARRRVSFDEQIVIPNILGDICCWGVRPQARVSEVYKKGHCLTAKCPTHLKKVIHSIRQRGCRPNSGKGCLPNNSKSGLGNLSSLWAPGDCREEEENGMVAESDTFPLLFVVKLSVNWTVRCL